jgi:5-methylthioadenosine/S-adenosylhomocysteine deaminase
MGAPAAGEWARQWPQDLERLQKKYFSSTDQLVTLRMFSPPLRENWQFARRLGLRITTEFQGRQAAAALDELACDKLVGPDNTSNHCGALPERTWQIFIDTGVNINVCPRSDAQYALGEGISALQHAWDHGIKPGLSSDNETSYGGEMFTEMRRGAQSPIPGRGEPAEAADGTRHPFTVRPWQARAAQALTTRLAR